MELRDALFYWLQMKVVCEARPQDQAAKDTLSFFDQILTEDHSLSEYSISLADETGYQVVAEVNGETKTYRYDRELTDQLLADIAANPKYNS